MTVTARGSSPRKSPVHNLRHRSRSLVSCRLESSTHTTAPPCSMHDSEAGAKSGWQRGQEIYFYRCWMCHNEYVLAGDHFPVPSLRDLFERQDEEYVRSMIRVGAPMMPTYGPETLTDKDVDDLVTYLKEKCGTFETGGGCFDEHNPPRNPLYRFAE